jgi:drug/metabolite transporter (DMT)-like permease
MIEGLALAVSAAVIYGFFGICLEVAGKRHYKIWDVILVKQFAGFCIGLVCTAFLRIPFLDWHLFGLGLIGAVAYVVTLHAYLVASREKDVATNWTIVNLSVVLPILMSVVFFGDAFTLIKIFGVVCTVISIAVIGGASHHATSSRKSSVRWVMSITLAFLLNGILAVLFRFVPEHKGTLFTAYFYGLSWVLVMPMKLLMNREWKPAKGLVWVSTASAITHWSGMMLTIAALAEVGKTSTQTGVIVYPITNGLVIPVGVILGVLLLKQHVNLKTGIGVGIGVAALICLFYP